jgi:hypothetical protein
MILRVSRPLQLRASFPLKRTMTSARDILTAFKEGSVSLDETEELIAGVSSRSLAKSATLEESKPPSDR